MSNVKYSFWQKLKHDSGTQKISQPEVSPPKVKLSSMNPKGSKVWPVDRGTLKKSNAGDEGFQVILH